MYLETARLIVREFVPEDAAGLQEILGNEAVMEFLEPAYTPERTREFLHSFCIDRHGAAAVVERDSGRLVGYLLFKDQEPDVYEMGWIFRREVWRRGYAYESCRAVIAYAFDVLRAHKIFAETIDGVKSVGLMKKLGMRPEGIQRSHTRDQHGAWADVQYYGILAEERT